MQRIDRSSERGFARGVWVRAQYLLPLALCLLALALLLGGCATMWTNKNKEPNYSLPGRIPIYLAVSDNVAHVDDGGMIAALVETLESDLREEGHSTPIIAARLGERPPVPRIELQVTSAQAEDGKLRGAGQLAGILAAPLGVAVVTGGAGKLVVECYVVSKEQTKPLFSGRLAAHSWGTMTGRDSVSAGERAGHAIASALEN